MRRFLSTALGLALLGLVAGCDVQPLGETYTGPIVEFGAASANVSEGEGTVTIPVELSNANGQSVTVEVLYAEGASTADFGADFENFGATNANGLQVATVTFSGAADETIEVSFDVIDDGEIEAAEEAVFALQQPQNARLGDQRQYTVLIGTLPIAQIRERANGDIVTVEGVVTRAQGRLTYIQDNTGGIAIFSFDSNPFGEAVATGQIEPGVRVQLQGEITEFGQTNFPPGDPGTGLKQVTDPDGRNGDFIEFIILGTEDVPQAQPATIAQLTEEVDGCDTDAYESELVRVSGLTIDNDGDFVFQTSKNYTVTGPEGNTMILRPPSGGDTEIGGVPIPQGEFTFVGVIGQFRCTNQLSPIDEDAIIPAD